MLPSPHVPAVHNDMLLSLLSPLHVTDIESRGSPDNRLSNMSLCTAGTCGDGSTRLGPVEAGNNYTCTVTASNALGNTTSDTNVVIAFSGKTLTLMTIIITTH